MVSAEVVRNRQFYNRFWVIFIFLGLMGCLSDDPIAPDPFPPEPPRSAFLCAPFINTGYCDKLSYHPGERMQVFFESSQPVTLCRITLFSLSGDSVFSIASTLPKVPQLSADASVNGYDYPVAVEFTVPELKSGIYLIENKIPFIVKTQEAVDIVVVYPSNTANAYAVSGGKSLYSAITQRPTAVSFQRPIALQSLSEFCLKWFTSLTDLRIGFVADMDMDNYENIAHAKVLVIPGHSEYWTRPARKNFDQFVGLGGHALILSGNTMWWQVRYSEDKKKLICYKDVLTDPIHDLLLKTIEWNSPSLKYSILSSIGAHFPNGGYGLRDDRGWNGYKIVTPTSPLFEGLDLKKGDIFPLPSLEYDGSPLSGYDEGGYPILDLGALNFEKVELLAFDKGYRVTETTGTFIVFQKAITSGIIINTASTDWCSANGMGGRSEKTIKAITYNALMKLVNNEVIFSQ